MLFRSDEARADDGQAAKAARREARIVAAMADLVARLRESTAPVRSQAQLAGLIGGERTVRQDAIARLLATGKVVVSGATMSQVYTVAGVDQ